MTTGFRGWVVPAFVPSSFFAGTARCQFVSVAATALVCTSCCTLDNLACLPRYLSFFSPCFSNPTPGGVASSPAWELENWWWRGNPTFYCSPRFLERILSACGIFVPSFWGSVFLSQLLSCFSLSRCFTAALFNLTVVKGSG